MDDTPRCPVCNSPLHVISSKPESPIGTTEVFNVIQMGCLNDSEPTNEGKPCIRYAGGVNPNLDLITTIKNPF